MRSWQSYLITTVLKLSSRRGKDDSISYPEQRENFETMMNKWFSEPLGVDHREQNIEGVMCDWADSGQKEVNRTVLYLHGGGYCVGSPKAYRDLTSRLALAAEAKVLAVDYRLGPEHKHPAALEDALTCYRWLIAEGTRAEQIIIAGDSAGGGLTLATMVALKQAGDPLPGAAVCLSPWADLTTTGDSMVTNAKADPVLSKESLDSFTDCYLGDADVRDPLLSPCFADLSGLPPLLVQVGSTEVLYDDARRVVEKVLAAGGQAELDAWTGMPHIWQAFAAKLPEGRAAIVKIGQFIQANTPA
ncbi:MAG: alpha/beta hydrolase [Gammaproteobacteria bacterium]|nr:alpha/beta hydrolase [Gammaproteobacteria bacterium]